jgi:tetratricopeptide (TPR) repeat protein
MGETDGALEDYHRALSLKEDSLEALNGILMIYSGRQEYANAFDALQKIHELQPDNPDVYYNYACLYSRQNNIEDAIKWLGLAVEKGFSNWELIMKDPDLAGIRNTPFVMDLMKGRQEKPAEGF